MITERGHKRVGLHVVASEHAENVTVVACADAIGDAIPPTILFKGIRTKPEYGDDLPPHAEFQMTPKGSMTTSIPSLCG